MRDVSCRVCGTDVVPAAAFAAGCGSPSCPWAPKQVDGASYVCEVPTSLGRVTNLSTRGGRVVAETESGIKMIVPAGKQER